MLESSNTTLVVIATKKGYSMTFDPYKILGLEKTATKEEIKTAFKTLAVQHHPDKNPGGNDQMFKDVSAAYDILMDDEKRRMYDEVGIFPESSPEAIMTQLAIRELKKYFSSITDQAEDKFFTENDVIAKMREGVNINIGNINKGIGYLTGRIEKFKKMKEALDKRLKAKSSDAKAPPMMHSILVESILISTMDRNKYEDSLKVMTRVNELLDECTYEKDKSIPAFAVPPNFTKGVINGSS